jgi:hypothetical protein
MNINKKDAIDFTNTFNPDCYTINGIIVSNKWDFKDKIIDIINNSISIEWICISHHNNSMVGYKIYSSDMTIGNYIVIDEVEYLIHKARDERKKLLDRSDIQEAPKRRRM